jgi:hypothetical protein
MTGAKSGGNIGGKKYVSHGLPVQSHVPVRHTALRQFHVGGPLISARGLESAHISSAEKGPRCQWKQAELPPPPTVLSGARTSYGQDTRARVPDLSRLACVSVVFASSSR